MITIGQLIALYGSLRGQSMISQAASQENRAGMNTSCGNSLSEANVCKLCFLGIGGIYRIEQVSQSG